MAQIMTHIEFYIKGEESNADKKWTDAKEQTSDVPNVSHQQRWSHYTWHVRDWAILK